MNLELLYHFKDSLTNIDYYTWSSLDDIGKIRDYLKKTYKTKGRLVFIGAESCRDMWEKENEIKASTDNG